MKPLFRFAMLALVLVAVALVSALTAMRFAIHGQEVEVPAIVGLTPSDAERAVAGLGLQIEVERQYYSPQIPEGRIMTQLPLPGTKVRRGWQLRVAQSMGPQRVAIPDVTKQSERAAEWNIRRRGLDVVSTAEMQLPGTPADQVLAQSPPANASQVAAPRTSLLVAVAPDPAAYVMPSFVGQPLGTASRTLQDAGFKLGNISLAPPAASVASQGPALPDAVPSVSTAPPEPSPASMIVTQWPPAGQKVLAGAVVNFEVR
jgi:beta-lactam-binding protein with PASTA domain